MSAKFTPGPWVAADFQVYCAEDGDPVGRANRRWNSSGEEITEFNARLIAAAPDMYEALKEAQWLLDNGNKVETYSRYSVAEKVAKALSKAEGRE